MKTILLVINDIDFFLSHRKKIGLAALEKNYRFIICAPKKESSISLEELGFDYIKFPLSRGGKNIFKELMSFFKLFLIIKKINPNSMHLVTTKPVIYGGLISKLLGNIPILVAFPGLGHIYTSNDSYSKLLRKVINLLYKFIFSNPKHRIIFHNKSDANKIIREAKINPKKCSYTYGSGVDLEEFEFSHMEDFSNIKFLFASRLLKDKGVHDFFKAAEILKKESLNEFQFIIAGDIDKENPSSISQQELEEWISTGIIKHIPYTKNIKEILRVIHVAVLPSYREGMPKILLEASSVGRPLITTTAPGCNECVKQDFNGLKIEAGDFKELSNKMRQLGTNRQMLTKFGSNSRKLAEERYSEKKVIEKHIELYKNLN